MRRIALLIALLVAGCGGNDAAPAGEGAGEFLQRITAYHLSGDFSRSWEELHPAHQKLISQIQFVYCGEREPELEEDTTVRVLWTKQTRAGLPRIPQRTVQAVRLQIRDDEGPLDTYTAHAVRVGARWRWVLSAPFVRAVERGNCLDGSPLP